MLTSDHITEQGYYWYFDPIGAPPVVVEVAGEPREELVVRWPGREEDDALQDLPGTFLGPLRPRGS
jgi:hypothetical protein